MAEKTWQVSENFREVEKTEITALVQKGIYGGNQRKTPWLKKTRIFKEKQGLEEFGKILLFSVLICRVGYQKGKRGQEKDRKAQKFRGNLAVTKERLSLSQCAFW